MDYTVYQQHLDSLEIVPLFTHLNESAAIHLAIKMNQQYKNTLDPYIFFVSRKSLKEINDGFNI